MCEGSGHCCKVGPCSLYWHTEKSRELDLKPWLNDKTGCPYLVWDPEANRYWCGLLISQQDDFVRKVIEESLAIGVGCCQPMFNKDRRNIR